MYYFPYKCHNELFKTKYIRNFVACVTAYGRLQCVHVINLKREYQAKFLHALRQIMTMFKRSHTDTYICNVESHGNGRIIHHSRF